MGWLWSSSSPSPDKPASSTLDKPAPPPPPAPSSSTNAPNEPSADAAELQKFMDLFQAEAATASKPQAQSQSPSSPSWFSRFSSSNDPSATANTPNAPRRDPVSESLLPTEMSCRQAFDLAWSCNGVGGQWNAVYRYGEMRSCSEQWNDFWFCMRLKSYSGPVKDEMVRTHYRNKEHAKYYEQGKPNSEDIWEARQAKATPDSVFTEGIEPPTVGDEEWREQESERRSKIRSGLGYDKP